MAPRVLNHLAKRYAVGVLASVLGRDRVFVQTASTVSSETDAFRAAGKYVTKGPGRRVIARLLLSAAGPEHDPDLVTELADLGDSAFRTDGAVEAGDARRWLREEVRGKMRFGAELLARRGAGCCLECGTRLSVTRNRSTHGWERRDYCDPCSEKGTTQLKMNIHTDAIREVLDRAAAAVLDEGLDRLAARRVRRSGSVSRRA